VKHVLILGARAPACLEWARAFAKAGWRVSVADSLDWPLARASASAHHFFRLPEPRRAPQDWIRALLKLARHERIDLLLPTCEEVFYLAHGLQKLSSYCRVFTSGFALLHNLHHKHRFALQTAGWPVKSPETRLLESAAELGPFAERSTDWVFKPAYSRFASRTLIRPDARVLSRLVPTLESPWVAQRFCSGKEHSSFSVLVNGTLRAHACYHSRHKVGKGSGIHFTPTDPPAVRAALEHFGRTTGYTGQVGFDFIETEAGAFHVLECNPRATSGVHLFDNQPAALVACLDPDATPPVLTPTRETRMVALAMLLFAAPRAVWHIGFRRDFTNARDVISRDGDHGPLAAQLLGLAEICARAVHRRCGLLAASTSDIEWDGQELPPMDA
jgi:hypothetical protein